MIKLFRVIKIFTQYNKNFNYDCTLMEMELDTNQLSRFAKINYIPDREKRPQTLETYFKDASIQDTFFVNTFINAKHIFIFFVFKKIFKKTI